MRNSLLKLGTPAALIVFGSCVGFVACGSHPWDQYDPYTPFKIFVDSVEARGQLTVEDNEELFFLNKGNELILEIPKYEEVGVRGLHPNRWCNRQASCSAGSGDSTARKRFIQRQSLVLLWRSGPLARRHAAPGQ